MDTSAPLVVVMGVSGAGKTTVGQLLAARLDVPYRDADSFHSETAIAAMAAGTPLTDSERWPWLDRIGRWLAGQADHGAVVSCSALRRSYRDHLRGLAPELVMLYLHGDADLIARRQATRPGHFMPAGLERSQFNTLEPPDVDEPVVAMDVALEPAALVEAFCRRIGAEPG